MMSTLQPIIALMLIRDGIRDGEFVVEKTMNGYYFHNEGYTIVATLEETDANGTRYLYYANHILKTAINHHKIEEARETELAAEIKGMAYHVLSKRHTELHKQYAHIENPHERKEAVEAAEMALEIEQLIPGAI